MNSLLFKPLSKVIKDIWLAMSVIYGNRWISGFGAQPNALALRIWSKGLEGLDENQIQTGIEACLKLTDDWPPSLPQFRKLCLAIPPLITVKQNIAQSERTAFTQFVMGFLDHWQYRQADQYQADKLLRNAYELAVMQRMEGAPLPKPSAALLENKPAAPVDAMTADQYMSRKQATEKAIKEIKEEFAWN